MKKLHTHKKEQWTETRTVNGNEKKKLGLPWWQRLITETQSLGTNNKGTNNQEEDERPS